jgi:hypothetical protein
VAFTTVTVTGAWFKQDNSTPATGDVTFELNQPLRDTSTSVAIAPEKKTITLNGFGAVAFTLAATKDATTAPVGGTYHVTLNIEGIVTEYDVEIPTTGSPIPINILPPVETRPNYSYVPFETFMELYNRVSTLSGGGGYGNIATDTFLGRDTAGTGAVEVLGPVAARGILDVKSNTELATYITNGEEARAKAAEGALTAGEITAGGLRAMITAHTGAATSATVHGMIPDNVVQYNSAQRYIEFTDAGIFYTPPAGKQAIWFTGQSFQWRNNTSGVKTIMPPIEYAPTKEIMPITGTEQTGAEHVLTAMPAGYQEFKNHGRFRFDVTINMFTQARLIVPNMMAQPALAGPKLVLRYWDGSAYVVLGSAADTPYCLIDNTIPNGSPSVGGWQNIVAAAFTKDTADGYLRMQIASKDGNASVSPQVSSVVVQFR